MASITGWKCRWPNITAPSMTSSDSSLASDSTISTASVVPATTRSSWLSAISSSCGLSTYSLLMKPTRAAPIGPMNGAPDSVSAAEAATMRDDVGIVLQIVRQHGDDDLRVAAPAVGEQRTDRAVDQARDQRLLFGRTAFALEIAAGNAAGGVVFFLVVDGEREEVDAFLRLLGRDDGGEHGGLAVGGEHGAVGLARDLAGLEDELAPAPIEFNSMDIEHCVFLSWFSARPESHEQDGEKLSRVTARCGMRTASGDPAMAFRTLPCREGRTLSGPACRRQRHRRRIKSSECVTRIRSRNARGIAPCAGTKSAADAELLDQSLVAASLVRRR